MSGIRFAVPARKGCPCWESGGPAWARLGSEKGWAGLGDVGTPEMLVSLKLRFKKKIHQLSNSQQCTYQIIEQNYSKLRVFRLMCVTVVCQLNSIRIIFNFRIICIYFLSKKQSKLSFWNQTREGSQILANNYYLQPRENYHATIGSFPHMQ